MIERALLGLVVVVACKSSSSEPPASQKAESQTFDIKPVATPHEPTAAELGPPVDVATGYRALCASVPDDGAPRPSEEINSYIRGAMFQYPNPEVIRFWSALGTANPADRMSKFRAVLDAAGIKSCRLYDLMQRR